LVADINDELQQDAIRLATEAIQKFPTEREMAQHVKKEFDRLHKPAWNCVIGKSFGSFVCHESKAFTYFSVGPYSVLLFRTSTI